MTHRKRTTALALASALAGSAAVLTLAPSAHADVVDVAYNCATPIGDKSAVSPIDIKAVKAGDGYKLTMSFQKGVSSSPIELGKGAMSPGAVILVGGADKGSVPVSGPPNPKAVPADTPIKITDLSGTYTPKKSGKVTFTAGVLTIKAMGTTTTCTPGNSPKPSLELDVTAPGGGAAPPPPRPRRRAATASRRPAPPTPPLRSAPSAPPCCSPAPPAMLWLTRRGRQARS